LCSVGIVFKLCHALLKTRPLPAFDLRRHLDLVALGTVADIVPLESENRILVHHGSKEIAKGRLLGLSRLLEVAGVRPPIISEHIGFRLGPRLNAAGRLTNAEKALRLLLTNDLTEATTLAAELDFQNRERQELERKICQATERRSVALVTPAVYFRRAWLASGVFACDRKVTRPTISLADDQSVGGKNGRSVRTSRSLRLVRRTAGKIAAAEMAADCWMRRISAFVHTFEVCES
jgi:single-stranded-DNA-specific exonuclease